MPATDRIATHAGRKFRQSWVAPIISMIVFAIIGYGLDFGANAYVQLILQYVIVNVVLALSLNLVNGFTGQFSIGHAGFMAVGAYCSAYLSTQPWAAGVLEPLGNLSFIFYTIAGGSLAALFGLIVGLPSLRLRGDYLAIVTLGFSEIIRVALLNTQAVGGARGMYGIPAPTEVVMGPITISHFYASFLLNSFWLIITFLVLWRLVHSTHGRAFLSVREDEIAAQAMGIDTTRVKVRAFVISSFFAGVAGSLFAHVAAYLNPASFGFAKSVDVIIMVVLGGMGSLTGSVLAAIIVTIVPEFVLRPLQEYTGVDLRMVIYSLALILFMIARPQGLFGTLELPDLFSRRTRKARSEAR